METEEIIIYSPPRLGDNLTNNNFILPIIWDCSKGSFIWTRMYLCGNRVILNNILELALYKSFYAQWSEDLSFRRVRECT